MQHSVFGLDIGQAVVDGYGAGIDGGDVGDAAAARCFDVARDGIYAQGFAGCSIYCADTSDPEEVSGLE